MAEKEKKADTPSAQTDQARQDALDHGSRKPGAYVSKWQQMLDAAMEKILNREKFSYDLNGDALYRQYKDQAVKNGRLSMLDTLGASAALTGGYGSSYGQTAAQQSYQRSMDGLTDRAAALYDRARENYDREGEQERSRYNLLKQRESSSRSAYEQHNQQGLNAMMGGGKPAAVAALRQPAAAGLPELPGSDCRPAVAGPV